MGPSRVERLVAKALLVGRHVARQLTGRLDAEQTNAACGLLGQHALCPARQRASSWARRPPGVRTAAR